MDRFYNLGNVNSVRHYFIVINIIIIYLFSFLKLYNDLELCGVKPTTSWFKFLGGASLLAKRAIIFKAPITIDPVS